MKNGTKSLGGILKFGLMFALFILACISGRDSYGQVTPNDSSPTLSYFDALYHFPENQIWVAIQVSDNSGSGIKSIILTANPISYDPARNKVKVFDSKNFSMYQSDPSDPESYGVGIDTSWAMAHGDVILTVTATDNAGHTSMTEWWFRTGQILYNPLPSTPLRLQAGVSTSFVKLRWAAGDYFVSPAEYYAVYRNGELIGTTKPSVFEYTDDRLPKHFGVYKYSVTAITDILRRVLSAATPALKANTAIIDNTPPVINNVLMSINPSTCDSPFGPCSPANADVSVHAIDVGSWVESVQVNAQQANIDSTGKITYGSSEVLSLKPGNGDIYSSNVGISWLNALGGAIFTVTALDGVGNKLTTETYYYNANTNTTVAR